MPQPFQDLDMQKFQNLSVEEMKKHLFKPAMPPTELTLNSKVATLSHFLVHNFREELSSEEHIIDTAMRLLSKEPEAQASVAMDDDSSTSPDNQKSYSELKEEINGLKEKIGNKNFVKEFVLSLSDDIEKRNSELQSSLDKMGKILMSRDGDIEALNNDLLKYKALAEGCFPYIQDLQGENYTDQNAGVFKDKKLEEIYNTLKQQL